MKGAQKPRILVVPDPKLPSKGKVAIEIAERGGRKLDPWQKLTLTEGLRYLPDGRWAAFEVAGNVPRQNGKGDIEEARELTGILEFGEELVTHSAHLFDTSMEAFLRMEAFLEQADLQSELKDKGGVNRSHGTEGFAFKNGGRIRYRTRTKGGGRGFSGNLIVFDEAMVISQFSLGALLPTLSAQVNPQVWYFGSAVDQMQHDHGYVFARVRQRALEGDSAALAYLEWSLDYDKPEEVPEEVARDPKSWAAVNPAYGVRIDKRYVENEIEALDARSFAIERLGVGDWPDPDLEAEVPIDIAEWDALAAEFKCPPACVALDVSPDRGASIVSAGLHDGVPHLSVIDKRPGTAWVVPRLLELKPELLIRDSRGPASSLDLEPLERAGIAIRETNTQELGEACGRIVDAVSEQALTHDGNEALRQAVKGARTRTLTDAWLWSRVNSAVDISPLVAATLVLWGVGQKPPEAFVVFL